MPESSPITEDEYLNIQYQLVTLAGLVATMDLDAFLAEISLCESIAPIVDPTAWLKGAGKLDTVKRLAEGLLPFKKIALDVISKQPQHKGDPDASL